MVEPECDDQGAETGFYLVTIGEGRRLALMLLAKRKVIGKSTAIRCLLDTSNDPLEISLDENVTRFAMHPADQFERFRDLAEQRGWSAEDIGARFGVTAAVVRQRLRLAAVSPVLMQAYRDGEMTLDQLMAFAVTEDHTRQETVWEGLSWKDPSAIRRALAEGRVRANDRRAVFVGAEAYEAAGGLIERDLFADDHGGYFTDPGLLDRLALESKLTDTAEAVQAAGWKWVSVCLDFPHANGLRRLYPKTQPLSELDQTRLAELEGQYETLAIDYETDEDIPETVVDQLDSIAVEMEALRDKQSAYDPEDVARSGVFVVLDQSGRPQFEPGFVRSEDERPSAPTEVEPDAAGGGEAPSTKAATNIDGGGLEALVRASRCGTYGPSHGGAPRPLGQKFAYRASCPGPLVRTADLLSELRSEFVPGVPGHERGVGGPRPRHRREPGMPKHRRTGCRLGRPSPRGFN